MKKFKKKETENTEEVKIDENEKIYKITYSNIKWEINKTHFEKLKGLYSQNKINNDPNLFPERLFVLLSRYNTLNAPGYQAAIPENLFLYLNQKMKVSHESFASPLNCSLMINSFTSGFYDIDRYFGSKGSFFWVDSIFGSFEVVFFIFLFRILHL
jgi:hypothetical protein